MRKLLIITCLGFLLSSGLTGVANAEQLVVFSDAVSGVRLLEQNDNSMTLNVKVGAIDFLPIHTKGGDFILPVVDGFSHSHKIGEPSLPMVNRLISVPYGCELEVEILSSEIEEISLEALNLTEPLMPVQPSLWKSEDPAFVPFEYNSALYQQNQLYSLPTASVELKGVMRSLNLGMVSFSPVEYHPVEKTIRVYKELTIKVNYLHPDWSLTEETWRKHYSPVFEPVYDKIINYNTPLSGDDKDDLVKYPIKYLIVSDRMFESQLQPFIEWKIKKGFNVIVAYTDEVGPLNYDIKDYIDSLYNAGTTEDPAPSFVLLVGDDQQIPAFSGSGHITDRPFCEFTGDYYPEIYYGRFSAQNPGDLQPQIDKTLEYEQYLMPDPSYLAEVTLVAGYDYSHAETHGNGQINYGTIHYFNMAHGIDAHAWLHPASSQSGAAAAIIQSVSDGVGLYNYTAHCGHTGHGTPSFTTSDIPGLTNYHKYLLGIGNCCLPNTFGDEYSTPCFGEAFLQVEDKGGIGYIGATDGTQWNEDYWWGVGYGPVIGSGPTYEQTGPGAYDGIFHDHGEPISQHYVTNDAIIYAGNMGVTESGSSNENYYWEVYHLMGDPSVMSYMGVPITNSVSYPPVVLMIASSVDVQADPASYVGITYNGVLHGAGYVDASGTVTINLVPFDLPGTADIVVTGQNKIPYVSTIQIASPEGPFVLYDDNTINDVSGNGNGLVDVGEPILLGIQLKNVGPDEAFNVEAKLTTTDGYVDITDSTEFYGNIPGNDGTSYIADGFAFIVSNDAPDGHIISFDLAVSGSDRLDTTWTSSFVIPVYAPILDYLFLSFDDNASGNGNGVLDPGETADLVVTIGNEGSGIVDNVSGVISESDIYVSIDDDTGYFGTVTAGGGTSDNSSDVFTISADGSSPQGHEMTFDLNLTGDNGLDIVVNFNVIVGDRVPFFSDDFSYNRGWTGLGGSAEWMMDSAFGGGGDPAVDHTHSHDNRLLGNDLTTVGTYSSGLSSTYWVTSPFIDCTDFDGVRIDFYRWLGIEEAPYDNVYLQAYDGSSWVTVFHNESEIVETTWGEISYDLSAYADYNPDFQIRFGLGSTDYDGQYCGWNIDDIAIKGFFQGSGAAALDFISEELVDSLHPNLIVDEYLRVYNNGDGELRIRFLGGEDWTTFSTDLNYIPANDSLDFPITVNTVGMEIDDYVAVFNYSSNDLSKPDGMISLTIHIQEPDIDIPQLAIDEGVTIGQQANYPLYVNNNGPGILTYEVSRLMFDGKKDNFGVVSKPGVPIGYHPTDPDKPAEPKPIYPPVEKGTGGPDLWGYSWIDSDEPGGPTYDWVDVSTVGAEVTLLDDDTTAALSIGFGFPFYENVYNELQIGSNGLISFVRGQKSRSNTFLPMATEPNNIIAMWWDDLDPRKGGHIYYYYDDTNERFIVSFVEIRNYQSPDGTGSLTFQAVLYPNGLITLQYRIMDPGEDTEGLQGATIGIENALGDDGLTVVYNAEYMQNNLAVNLKAASWLTVSPGGGTILPFSIDTLDVGFDAGDLEIGAYSGQLKIVSNDLDTPTWIVPVTMNVHLPFKCGDVNDDDEVDVLDILFLIEYKYKSGEAPDPIASGDVNSDGEVDILDIIYLIQYKYKEGPEPNCP